MYKTLLILFLFNLLSLAVFSQKKILGPDVYNDWKRISGVQLSDDGKYAAYIIKPHRGDGFLYLVNIETGGKDSVARGINPEFSGNSAYLFFQITPAFDTLRNMELRKVPKDKLPKNSLAIWDIQKDTVKKYEDLKEFQVSKDGTKIAFTSTKNDWPKNYLSKKETKAEAKKEKKKGKIKSDGNLLTVIDLETNKKVCFRHVSNFEFSYSGKYLVIQEHEKQKKDSLQLKVFQTSDLKSPAFKLPKRVHAIAHVVFNDTESAFAFMQSNDTNKLKWWSLLEYNFSSKSLKTIVDSTTTFEKERALSNNFKPYYKNNDGALFFGVGPKPEADKKDTLTESEKVKLDLWHWKDERLQPQQVHELHYDETKTIPCVLWLADNRIVELTTDSVDLDLNRKRGELQYFALASNDRPYKYKTWETPNPEDLYLVDYKTGKHTLLQEKAYSRGALSPSGKNFIFWNEKSQHYFCMNTESEVETCMTCDYSGNLLSDLNGQPMMDSPLGIAGFSQKETGVLLRSQYDLLFFDFKSNRLYVLNESLKTGNLHQDTLFEFNLYKLNNDSSAVYPESAVLTRFNRISKSMDVYRVKGQFPALSFELISGSNHNYTGFQKAKNDERVVFHRSSNTDYPDIYATTKPGMDIKRLSVTNPQQSEYNWSTVELINWTSYSGIPLQGLLYKPEDFDTNQSYPLLVYYYEMYSDEIHNHYAPRPTASIIFPTEYASAGYVVFIPDIRYKVGHPAESAFDCIMSGTDAVLTKYNNIDSKRMGLQGQSWGGYQTAQLVTMTNRFAAAMAGAPVSNMFSAYGGIRWGSGYSRQFQYEHTQSRIGKTIWEAPELYVENSPIFHLTKVKTPLLIMHNDEDGAVPWYQGIELFTGLRRLQKPVWLLNYNGDDHNLMKNANRMDLSIRMRQFFDYYLLEKPAPLWLLQGIPALEKGKKMYYELSE